MSEEMVKEAWFWTEKAERISFGSALRAGQQVGGEPAWDQFQQHMPTQLIEQELVVRVWCCGDQVIWNWDQHLAPLSAEEKRRT